MKLGLKLKPEIPNVTYWTKELLYYNILKYSLLLQMTISYLFKKKKHKKNVRKKKVRKIQVIKMPKFYRRYALPVYCQNMI